MSCNVAYNKKKYTSKKGLEKAVEYEMLYNNIEDVHTQDFILHQQDIKEAQTILQGLGETTLLKGLPTFYQEQFVNVISSLILDNSKVKNLFDKETLSSLIDRENILSKMTVGYKKKTKKELRRLLIEDVIKTTEEQTIYNKYISNIEKFITKTEKRIKDFTQVHSFLSLHGVEKTLAELEKQGQEKSDIYNIIKSKPEDSLETITTLISNLNVQTKVANKGKEHSKVLFSIAIQTLKSNVLVNVNKEKQEEKTADEEENVTEEIESAADDEIEVLMSDGQNVRSAYIKNRTFTLNGKDQLTANIKNLLLGISKAIYKGEDDNGNDIIEDIKFVGQKQTIPFDVVYEQLTIIHALAYQHYDVKHKGKDKFATLMNELREHIPNVPYLKNVIDVLEKADKSDKNGYASNMGKAPINHVSTNTSINEKVDMEGKNVKTFYLNNFPTNNFNNSKIFLKKWEKDFFNMDFVSVDAEGGIIFDEEGLAEFFEKAERIEKNVKSYFSTRMKIGENKYSHKPNTTAKRKALINAAKRPTKEFLESIRKDFNDLGITISPTAIKMLYDKGYYSKGNSIDLRNIATVDAGYFGALKNALYDKKGNIKVTNITDNSIFKDGYIKEFAKFVTKYDSSVYASSYKNSEGKTLYGFSLPSFFTDRMKDLKTNTEFLKELSEDNFQGNSLILQKLYNKDTDTINDSAFREFFDFFTFDTNDIIGSKAKAKPLHKLSKAGIEQVALNFHYNHGTKAKKEERNGKTLEGNKYEYRNGKAILPPMADKSRVLGINTALYILDMKEGETKINKDNALIDLVLEEVVYPEYKRILKEQEGGEINIENYKAASSLFYFIPELNYENNHILFETGEDNKGLTRGATGHIVNKTLKPLDSNALIKTHLRDIVYNHIEKLKQEKLEFWKDSKIVVNNRMKALDGRYSKGGYNSSPDVIAYEFVINSLITNATFFKLFAGDPAMYFKHKKASTSSIPKSTNTAFDYIYSLEEDYIDEASYNKEIRRRTNEVIESTLDNTIKRLAGVIAPGTEILGEYNEKIQFAIIQDISKKGARSSNMKYYTKLFDKVKAETFYGRMKRTDAMGYSTFSEWLNVEYQRGSINEKQYKGLLSKDTINPKLTPKDIRLIKTILHQNLVNSYKPVYFNNFTDGNTRRTLYVKQSSLPLLEFLTRGTDLDNLRKAMVRDKVGHVVFKTAVKTGSPKESPYLFDENGQFKDDISFVNENNKFLDFVITAPKQGHKIQLDIPIHKKVITDGSQQRNILFADMLSIKGFVNPFTGKKVLGQKMKELLNEKYDLIFQEKSKQLKEELNYNEDTNKIDLEKLQEILLKEFTTRGLSTTELDYLNLTTDTKGNPAFVQPLWINNLSSKIESILISIITNRVKNLKVSGRSFTLGSDVGFKPKQIIEGEDAKRFIEENQENLVIDKEWAEESRFVLRGQRTENKVVKPAEIMIPSVFRDKKGRLINSRKFLKDGFIDKGLIPDEMLRMFGYRIPSQSPNSLSYVKVVAFLPDVYSELIIAPAEFTAQMGSDFDIDKLYIQHYTYEDIGKDNVQIKRIDRYSPDTNKGEKYSSKKYINSLVNDILDIKLNTLSNPSEEVQKKILTPLDDNIYKGLSEIIDRQVNENKTFYSPYSQNNFQDKFLSGTVGMEAIGVFARATILNSMLNNRTVDHSLITKEGKKIIINRGVNNNGSKKTNNSLNVPNLKDTDEYTKADLYSMMVSSSVDNANEQILGKLNINKETYNFIIGDIASGFDAETTIYFLNQPIIIDYVKFLSKAKDSTITGYNYKDVIKELYTKYKGLIILPKEEEYLNNITAESFNSLDTNSRELEDYTLNDLKNNIKDQKELSSNDDTFNENYQIQQTLILKEFISSMEVYKSLGSLQKTTNVEGTKGFGNTVFYMLEKEAEIRDIEGVGITNTEMLLGTPEKLSKKEGTEENIKKLTDKGYKWLRTKKGEMLFIKPTTIVGSLAFNGLFLGNVITQSDKTLFPYNNPVINRLVNKAYHMIKESFDDDSAELRAVRKKEALHYVKQYLYSGVFDSVLKGTIEEERNRLLIREEGRPSFVDILNTTKQDNFIKFTNNKLLQKIIIFPEPIGQVGEIKFDATKESTELNFVSNAFITLLEDTSNWYSENGVTYTGARIAMDLLRHQYVTGGIQFRNQFIKYLPIEIFEKLGLNEKIRNLDINKISDKIFTNFEAQLGQHFPKKIGSIDTETYNSKTGTIEIAKEGNEYLVMKADINGIEMLFIKDEETADIITYKYIPHAGHKTFKEFDSSVTYIDSVVQSNNKIESQKREDLENNITRLEELFSKEMIYEINIGSIEEPVWGSPKDDELNFEDYQRILTLHKDEEYKVRIISTTDSVGVLTIYNMKGFTGLVNFNKDIIFNEVLIEGVDYLQDVDVSPLLVLGEKIEDKMEADSSNKKFQKAYNFAEDAEPEIILKKLINKHKRKTKDPFKKYLYSLFIDAVPTFIKDNPNFVFNFYENNKGGGKVDLINGKIVGISLNSNIIGDIKEERIIVEEILHALTVTDVIKASPVFRELSALRLEVLDYLKANPKQQETYLKVKENSANNSALNQFFSATGISAEQIRINIKSSSKVHKDTEVYKTLLKELSKDNVNLEELKKRLYSKYKSSDGDFARNYGLVNNGEFIASMLFSPAFQDRMNAIPSKKKLSIVERFIAFLVKALQRLGKRNVNRKTQVSSDTFFPNDINPDTVLEVGVAKIVLGLKNYKKSLYADREKNILQQSKEYTKAIGKVSLNPAQIRTAFGIQKGHTLVYSKDARKIAKVIKDTFSNVKVRIYKNNYIVVEGRGEDINAEQMLLEVPSNLETEVIGKKRFTKEEREQKENRLRELINEKEEIIIYQKDSKEDNRTKDIRKAELININKEIREIEKELTIDDSDDFDTFFNLEFETVADIIPTRQSKLNTLKFYKVKQIDKILIATREAINNDINVSENTQKEKYYVKLLEVVKSTENKKKLETLETLEDLLVIATEDIDNVKTLLTTQNNLTESELVYAREILNNWNNVFNNYFTGEEEAAFTAMVSAFNPIINESSRLLSETLLLIQKTLEKGVKKETGKKIDIVKELLNSSDVIPLTSYGYDISRVGDPLLSFVHITNKKASNETKRDINDRTKIIDTLIRNLMPVANKFANDENGVFNVFFQKYKDGTSTGDLVRPFAREFYEEIAKLYAGYDKLDSENIKKRKKKITSWYANNTEVLDINLLTTEKGSIEYQQYVDKMEDLLGKEAFTYLIEEQERKVKKYEKELKKQVHLLSLKYDINNEFEARQHPEANKELIKWEVKNSPKYFNKQIKTGKPAKISYTKNGKKVIETIYSEGSKYSVIIPRTTNIRNTSVNTLEYYDKNFKTILEHKELKEFYDYYMQTFDELKVFLPNSAKEAMHTNLVPFIEKTFMENIGSGGFFDVSKKFNDTYRGTIDYLKTSIREDNYETDESNLKNKKVKDNTRILDYNLFKNHKREWEEFFNVEVAKYMEENESPPPYSFEIEKQKEFAQKINNRKSKDLGKVLKTFAGLSLTYQHKSKIQDTLIAVEIFLNSRKDIKNDVKREMFEYYLDVFHGRSRKKGEFVSSVKSLTFDEKESKRNLETLIEGYKNDIIQIRKETDEGEWTEAEYELKKTLKEGDIKKREEETANLGGNVSGAGIGDTLLKAFQLKGLGWNVIAGINNMSFGIVANLVEAADGRVITEKEMYGAMKLTLNSVGRNITFNSWEGVEGEALKIRNLMDRNDILNEATHELYTNSVKGMVSKRFGWLLPYNVQKRTEYINQAPVMIAMYKKTYHKLNNGKTVSLYDAMTKEGFWNEKKYGKEPKDLINSTNLKIAQFIKVTHGNYDPLSAMKIKKNIIGRAIVIFRSWFFEAYAQRLGKMEPDHILGIELKGRYISFYDLAKGKGATNYGLKLVSLFKDAIFRIFGKRADYNKEGVAEVDAANMRKLVRELSIYLQLIGFNLLLSMLFRDDDIPENEQQALNLTLNSINRLTSELGLYTNPYEAFSLVNNPAPAMSMVTDLLDVIKAAGQLIVGEDEIETGRYAGESRAWNSTKSLVPGLSSYRNVETSLKEEYKPKTIVTLIDYLTSDD